MIGSTGENGTSKLDLIKNLQDILTDNYETTRNWQLRTL